ncbi:ATP-dependent helicase [Candidatus Saccharibacteria bacterium]|nr:ATP-dependent helicase [Candidatus Saccharibacteria bacterium]
MAEWKKLNPAQLEAVEKIYGPLLVLAGPGTGKTQLLSARVAEILQKTDVDARNILCLTFTESGAQNMRERLRNLIGDSAYDVTISTYHSFGSDIIKNYSEYFQNIATERSDDLRMERPIDELTQIQIVESIINALPFDSLLLSARYYVRHVVSTISDLKQHLISPDKLRKLANNNLDQIDKAQKLIDDIVNSAGGISNKKADKLAQYQSLLNGLSDLKGNLIELATAKLSEAWDKASEVNSPSPLRAWKDEWMPKDENDHFTLTDPDRSRKMLELANVYESYEQELRKRAAYDFDDMILRAIDGLKNNKELLFNLQERYQFILLDEFQDTNPSQFELVKRIADHEVHEGKPNIMAVGDDDQAIFAFQGANVGNMKDFLNAFNDVHVINLTENYRSHRDILHVARNISEQIEDRLHSKLDDKIDKILTASSANLPDNASIERQEFGAEASEYSWIADKINQLIKSGTKPSEIAVLAPRHKILENLVPFLRNIEIPLSYEKRENILEAEIVKGMRLNALLLEALIDNDTAKINEYFPLVLSLPYWQIEPLHIWSINWEMARQKDATNWPELALKNPKLKNAVNFYLMLSASAVTDPLELTLDKLAGTIPVENASGCHYAPLKEYYFAPDKRAENPLKYYEAISHLSVIRAHLRDHQASSEKQLSLQDFLNFFEMYESADTPLINSHPIAQSIHAVQLMTAYKAKGLEFDHVFIAQAHDDIWGSGSRGGSNKLSLPPNLQQIRYVNTSDDERRRLFFVAITRARHGLYISSHTTKDNGKVNLPLKYLNESGGKSAVLPEANQTINSVDLNPQNLAKDIETLWQAGQIFLPADFRALLANRLKTYQMSPTHLNTFIDMERAGPESFLVQTLLKFPQAPSPSGEYGTAIHNTLEWYQNSLNSGSKPKLNEVLKRYDIELDRRYLSKTDRDQARGKGQASLQKYLDSRTDMFKNPAKTEVNFYSEGVALGDARLSGKIDRLEIDDKSKTVRIADYKTGKPLKKWGSDMKSLKYAQQLYMYKILVEHSHTWRDYKVESARLEFVEPDNHATGSVLQPLYLDFNDQEEAKLKTLIQAVWTLIQSLDFPDISSYDKSAKGVKAFIDYLSKSET